MRSGVSLVGKADVAYMRNGVRFLLLFIILAVLFSAVTTGSPLSTVQGRIEILNPNTKMRNGEADASGVVVWLTPLKGVPAPKNSPPQKRELAQQNKRFIPHVMVVQVGTVVDFPNRDPFFHNVFSVFDGKMFDLGLYANGESKPVLFARPGISYIFCNIHPQMSAVVVTVESPYFAISAPDGSYSIKNVPPGDYQLHLWHERSDEQQLAAQSRIVSIGSAAAELGVIRLDEAGYIPRAHKDKYGQDYSPEPDLPAYRRP